MVSVSNDVLCSSVYAMYQQRYRALVRPFTARQVINNPAVADLDGKAGRAKSWHAERELIMGVWGAVLPIGSRGKAPRGEGVQGKPPEADEILAIKTVSLH